MVTARYKQEVPPRRAPYRYADRRLRPLGHDSYRSKRDPRYEVLAAVLGDSLIDWLNSVWWPRKSSEHARDSIDALMTIITLTGAVGGDGDFSGFAVGAALARSKQACCEWLIAHELEGLTCYRRGISREPV